MYGDALLLLRYKYYILVICFLYIFFCFAGQQNKRICSPIFQVIKYNYNSRIFLQTKNKAIKQSYGTVFIKEEAFLKPIAS